MTSNVLYGITHDVSGAPLVRVPRTVKVGIGRPAGPDIHVFIDTAGKWVVSVGVYGDKRTERKERFEKRDEAQAYYRKERAAAPPLKYPCKLQYFTFTRTGADGTLEPDWDAIEKHGPLPTEIDIVFADDIPLRAAYEWWSATGLQCRGDGRDAERLVTIAGPEDKEAAGKAKTSGAKFYQIENRCYVTGCPYARETQDRGRTVAALCKPHARLAFQLLNDIRLGAQAQFDTTSFRTVSQLHSSLLVLRSFTGGGDPARGFLAGLPLRMLVRPWKTNHNGQAGKAYAVSLEFRTETIQGLRQKMLTAAADFRQVMEAPTQPVPLQIAAPIDETLPDTGDDTGIAAEFYPQSEPEDVPLDEAPGEEAEPEDEPSDARPQTDTQRAQTATEQRTASLSEKLAARRKQQAAPVVHEHQPQVDLF